MLFSDWRFSAGNWPNKSIVLTDRAEGKNHLFPNHTRASKVAVAVHGDRECPKLHFSIFQGHFLRKMLR